MANPIQTELNAMYYHLFDEGPRASTELITTRLIQTLELHIHCLPSHEQVLTSNNFFNKAKHICDCINDIVLATEIEKSATTDFYQQLNGYLCTTTDISSILIFAFHNFHLHWQNPNLTTEAKKPLLDACLAIIFEVFDYLKSFCDLYDDYLYRQRNNTELPDFIKQGLQKLIDDMKIFIPIACYFCIPMQVAMCSAHIAHFQDALMNNQDVIEQCHRLER